MKERFFGRIKSLDAKKGYGFIERQGGKDLLFRISEIKSILPRTIHVGQLVKFNIRLSPDGPQAVKIVFTR